MSRAFLILFVAAVAFVLGRATAARPSPCDGLANVANEKAQTRPHELKIGDLYLHATGGRLNRIMIWDGAAWRTSCKLKIDEQE